MPKPKEERRRFLPGVTVPRGGLTAKHDTGTTSGGPVAAATYWRGRQITVSEGHHWPPPKPSGMVDHGGEFFTTRSYCKSLGLVPWSEKYVEGRWTYTYDGYVWSLNPSISWPTNTGSSDAALDAFGAQAIARCKPTNPVADAATFLGEIYKEGLPKLVGSQTWKDRSISAKNAGSEYLNVQFGWVPFVSEIRDFAKGVRKANAVLAQYERDAGRLVRRRYTFPTTRDVTETVLVGPEYGYPSGQNLPFGTRGRTVRRRETVRRMWFAGAFTYHLPSGYDSRKKMSEYAAKADLIFGTTPTPETIWNIAPWSWAVDWFTNTGDVISNVTDAVKDGLVMRYGYMMEHTTITDTYTIEGAISKTGRKFNLPPVVLVTETKKRRKANPFGFGVTWDGLSPYQISILAALGMSRSK